MPAAFPTERILVRGVNWLGDAVMTTPALLRLREAKPQAYITLLTPAKLADLWRHHPALDAVETFSAAESVWRIGRRLRAGKFDIGLVLPNSPRSALEIWLAGIPRRIGYQRPWRNWLLTEALAPRAAAVKMRKRSIAEIQQLIRTNLPPSPPSPGAHHIHQYLHLTAALGASREPLPPKLALADDAIPQFIAKFKLPRNLYPPPVYFGLNAFAEYGPAKRWPEARFIEAAIQIQRQTHCRWLIFGLKSESETAARLAANISEAAARQLGRAEVAANPRVFNLAGATSLAELCAALKLCRVVLTNDSGPMHLAAALGARVVALFGSTSPELTGPGLPGDSPQALLSAHAPCAPCFLRVCPIDFRCMENLTVEQVVAAVLK